MFDVARTPRIRRSADRTRTHKQTQVLRITHVLPFFASRELSGLADFLERELASRLGSLRQSRGSDRARPARTSSPTRAAG